MRAHPLGKDAARIGEVTWAHPGLVTMRTPFGTTRIVDMLPGDQLPRIC
jgi:hydrogenase expression/formation protein HypE